MTTEANADEARADDLDIAYSPEIRISVSYRNGQVTTAYWTAGMTEPAPDELAEMMCRLAPADGPRHISVTLSPGHAALADALATAMQERRDRMAATAGAVFNPDSAQPGDIPGRDDPAGESAETTAAQTEPLSNEDIPTGIVRPRKAAE